MSESISETDLWEPVALRPPNFMPIEAVRWLANSAHRQHHYSDQLKDALYDSLTGLRQRSLFYDDAERLHKRALDNHEFPAVIALDLDNLKPINDTHGHEAGDRLLSTIGEAIRQHTRVGDVTARLGGDEFAIVIPFKNRLSQGAMDIFASFLQARIEEHTQIAGQPATISVGIAPWLDTDLAAALSAADANMYANKQARKAKSAE